jgi:hypothetical protein
MTGIERKACFVLFSRRVVVRIGLVLSAIGICRRIMASERRPRGVTYMVDQIVRRGRMTVIPCRPGDIAAPLRRIS